MQSEYSSNPYGNNDPYVNSSPAPYESMNISQKQENDSLAHLSDGLSGQARKAFIFKVYLVLSIQLAITVAMCFVSYFVQDFQNAQMNNQWAMWMCFGLMIVSEIAIFCVPAGRRAPFNLILLLVFTLCEAYMVSSICSMVANQSGPQVVVVAAVMTLAIVVGLSVYAIFTPNDFTLLGGSLTVVLISLMLLGIFCIWFPFLENLYCCLGVVLFGIYLVVDTQLIVGGKRLQLSIDDYVVGALILYIDIIQIFLYILQMLSKK